MGGGENLADVKLSAQAVRRDHCDLCNATGLDGPDPPDTFTERLLVDRTLIEVFGIVAHALMLPSVPFVRAREEKDPFARPRTCATGRTPRR